SAASPRSARWARPGPTPPGWSRRPERRRRIAGKDPPVVGRARRKSPAPKGTGSGAQRSACPLWCGALSRSGDVPQRGWSEGGGAGRGRGPGPRVGELEVVEPDLPRHLAGRGEELDQQVAEPIGAEAVEVELAGAPRLDKARDPQQRQVMADGRLVLVDPLAQVGHVELALPGKVQEDPQPRL